MIVLDDIHQWEAPFSAYDLTYDQIEIFSIGTGNAPFELRKPDVFRGLVAWRDAIKAAMFLTTDNSTAQVKLLLGQDRCLRLEPSGADAGVEMDDYDRAFARLPRLATQHFDANRESIARFFASTVTLRDRHYSTDWPLRLIDVSGQLPPASAGLSGAKWSDPTVPERLM